MMLHPIPLFFLFLFHERRFLSCRRARGRRGRRGRWAADGELVDKRERCDTAAVGHYVQRLAVILILILVMLGRHQHRHDRHVGQGGC